MSSQQPQPTEVLALPGTGCRPTGRPARRSPGRVRPASGRAGGTQPGPGARATVRLTRRGRLLLVLLAGALALVAFSLGRVSTAASTTAAPVHPARTVVVQPGQTLWQIARAAAPHADPRVTVQRILDLNSLDGTSIRVGQQLALPAAG